MTRFDAHERHSLLRRIFTMTTRAEAEGERRREQIHEIEFADLGGPDGRAHARPAAASEEREFGDEASRSSDAVDPLERLLFATALELAIEAGGRWVSETRPDFGSPISQQ